MKMTDDDVKMALWYWELPEDSRVYGNDSGVLLLHSASEGGWIVADARVIVWFQADSVRAKADFKKRVKRLTV